MYFLPPPPPGFPLNTSLGFVVGLGFVSRLRAAKGGGETVSQAEIGLVCLPCPAYPPWGATHLPSSSSSCCCEVGNAGPKWRQQLALLVPFGAAPHPTPPHVTLKSPPAAKTEGNVILVNCVTRAGSQLALGWVGGLASFTASLNLGPSR